MSEKPFTIALSDGVEYQPLLSGHPQTVAMRSGRVCLMPGQECGRHTTGNHEEQLVFLSGRGSAQVGAAGEEIYPVAAGQIAYIPPHTLHNILNTGTEPLVYIYCVAPVPQKEVDYESD